MIFNKSIKERTPYRLRSDKVFNRIPIDEFINISGNPVVEKLNNKNINEYLCKATAYMMRRNGELIDLGNGVHPYIAKFIDSIELVDMERLAQYIAKDEDDLYWFYENTDSSKNRLLIGKLIRLTMSYIVTHCADDFDDAYTNFSSLGVTVSGDRKSYQYDDDVDDKKLRNTYEKVSDALNNEFCRVRTSDRYYGGSNNSIYFRISSKGFNWYNTIWYVVEENKNWISDVTIVNDITHNFYRHNGEYFDHMDTDYFLEMGGNPCVENFLNKKSITRKKLYAGTTNKPLEENLQQSRAYMLRDDGKLFELDKSQIHPYVDPCNFESNKFEEYPIEDIISDIATAEEEYGGLSWLQKHTQSTKTKNDIAELASMINAYNSYGYNLGKIDMMGHENDFDENSIYDFAEDLIEGIEYDTNQEFCRVRTSGKYFGGGGNSIYFRIGSEGFNWFNLIWKVVYDHKNWIDTVNILRDHTSDDFYRHNGQIIKDMPTDEFINLSGNPVIEKLNNKDR